MTYPFPKYTEITEVHRRIHVASPAAHSARRETYGYAGKVEEKNRAGEYY